MAAQCLAAAIPAVLLAGLNGVAALPAAEVVGRRIASTDHTRGASGVTLHYYYDGQNVVVEYDATGTPKKLKRYYVNGTQYIDERVILHVYGLSGLLTEDDFYYFGRELWSVEGLVNNRGHEVERYSYDAYGLPVITAVRVEDVDYSGKVGGLDSGAVRDSLGLDPCTVAPPIHDVNGDGAVDSGDLNAIEAAKGPALQTIPESGIGNPYAFTGRRMDFFNNDQPFGTLPQLRLYHYRGREYDPQHGRFLQRDPLGVDARVEWTEISGGPTILVLSKREKQYQDGMNLYEYVNSSPIMKGDPRGLYGRETHVDLTVRIAESALVGFQPDFARVLGDADIGIDGFIGPSGWLLWGLDWHFDIDTEGGSIPSRWDAGDSRHRHAQEQMEIAVRLCAQEGRVEAAVRQLGRGLHPIQDFYAHGNWRVWFFPSPIPLAHPAWYDNPNFDGHGPGGIPIQDPDDVWTDENDAIRGTTRYDTMTRHTGDYLQRFIREVRASNGPHRRCCLNQILRNP